MEIKFRAWHKGEVDSRNKIIFEPQMLYDENPGDCLVWSRHQNIEQVMQYTGLKDKNGKEIYVGDIIMWVPEQGTIVASNMEDVSPMCKIVVWLDDEARFGFSRLDGVLEQTGFCFCKMNFEDIGLVIGNIYENPNLLEDKE